MLLGNSPASQDTTEGEWWLPTMKYRNLKLFVTYVLLLWNLHSQHTYFTELKSCIAQVALNLWHNWDPKILFSILALHFLTSLRSSPNVSSNLSSSNTAQENTHIFRLLITYLKDSFHHILVLLNFWKFLHDLELVFKYFISNFCCFLKPSGFCLY